MRLLWGLNETIRVKSLQCMASSNYPQILAIITYYYINSKAHLSLSLSLSLSQFELLSNWDVSYIRR